MTDRPRALRAQLAATLPPAMSLAREQVSDGGATVKLLLALADGRAIETVLMHYPARTTVCVSTQAGCAMACGFCATGQAGFERHLTTGEILEQIVWARRRSAPRRVSNLHGAMGISARHLTLSTVGIVPGIRRLAGERLPVNLAVSLHAANDTLRDRLVPVNRRYPLAALRGACEDYLRTKSRRLSFEWALIDRVNDRPAHAAELAAYARPLRAHVNLIPLNPTPGYATRGTPPVGVREFRERVRELGVNVTVRRNRGTDIDAACGQLAGEVNAPARLSARRP
jgi:23S rRNA (adenine2503-C2)-methyltransferase